MWLLGATRGKQGLAMMGHLKFSDFLAAKMSKTPQNIPQISTFPIMTYLECSC